MKSLQHSMQEQRHAELMDPLSVASGVAGLVTLAEVVISRTYNTIITCKHASEDSRKLLREVQALAGILQSLAAL
jgi:hypothetical protein